MSRATVTREIARIEALGRTRALSESESRQLQKLVLTEKRYDYSRGRNLAERGRA